MRPALMPYDQVHHILASFNYCPETGCIEDKRTTVSLNDRKTVHVGFPCGNKINIPLPRLAYILAFKEAPRMMVRTRKEFPRLSKASRVEQKVGVKYLRSV